MRVSRTGHLFTKTKRKIDGMAVGDLYYSKINCSSENRAWSFGLWAEEVSPQTPVNNGRVIADAIHAHLLTALRGIISTESFVESVQSWRRHPGPSIPGFVQTVGGAGLRTGNTMPNNSALFINLQQLAQDAKYNGGIYLAGQSVSDVTDSLFTTAYLGTQVQAFLDVMPTFINAVGGDSGQWRFVVLSKTFTPASTPIGTPFDVVDARAATRVMTQRRRQTKIRGWS
jgi:hypothetical protein